MVSKPTIQVSVDKLKVLELAVQLLSTVGGKITVICLLLLEPIIDFVYGSDISFQFVHLNINNYMFNIKSPKKKSCKHVLMTYS